MPAPSRRDYLERLIPGLEQAIEDARQSLPYYKPDDIMGIYSQKFLASMEENLAKSRQELSELLKAEPVPAEAPLRPSVP